MEMLWQGKVGGLQYFKPISSMTKHFNKEFSSQILMKTVLRDSSVSKDTICKISVPDLERLRYAEHFKTFLGSRS
jgi:hypothetical protein